MADPIFEDILEELKQLNRAGGTLGRGTGASPAGAQQRSSSSRVAGLDLFDRQTRDSAKTMNDYINTTRRLTEEERQNARRKQRIDQEREKLEKKLDDAIAGTAKGLVNFGTSMARAPGSFQILNTVIGTATKVIGTFASKIPIFGQALAGLGEAAGQVAQFMVQQFEEAYGKFRELSDTGVIQSFEDLTRASDRFGLTFGDLASVLGKNSKDIAAFGGSAVEGRKRLESLTEISKEQRSQFMRLGVSQTEYTEYQLSYINQERLAGRSRNKTNAELLEGTGKYIQELDQLSKITGLSRKDLKQERESRMANVRYLQGIADLPESIRKEIDASLTRVKAADAEYGEGLQDLIASNGVANTEAAKKVRLALEVGGENVMELVQGMRSGAITQEQLMNRLKVASGKLLETTKPIGAIKGAETGITAMTIAASKFANQTGLTAEQQAELAKEQENQKNKTEGQNAELARVNENLYESARRIQNLAVSSDIATKAMDLMATGLDYLTEKMYELAGKELPAHLKARKEELKLIEKEKEARESLAKAGDDAEASMRAGETPESPISTDLIVKARLEAEKAAKEKLDKAVKEREAATKTRQKAEEAAGVYRPPGAAPAVSGGGRGTQAGPTAAQLSQLHPSAAGGAAKGGDFYSQIYATLYDEAKKAGVANPEAIARLGAAQSALETGYGKSTAGGNNYFGIKGRKGDSNVSTVDTQEYDPVQGKMVTVKAGFRKYGSMQESAADYIKFLQENPRYREVLNAGTAEEAIAAQGRTGYATDPEYARKLASINSRASTLASSASSTSALKSPPSSTVITKSQGDTATTGAGPGTTTTITGAAASSAPETMMEIKNGFAMMNSKYDQMIELLASGNKYQRQTATNTG